MKKYSWDFVCGDIFTHMGNTVFECVENAKAENKNREVKAECIYVGVNRIPDISYGLMAEEILDDMKEQAYDICGEASDEWLSNVTEAQISKLESMLSVTVQRFLKEEGLEIKVYEVSDIEEVSII